MRDYAAKLSELNFKIMTEKEQKGMAEMSAKFRDMGRRGVVEEE